MKLRRSLHSFFNRSPVLVFVLASLGGWCVFNLQIVSILRLLQEVSIRELPVLMILQAGVSWLSWRFFGKFPQKSRILFFLATVCAASLISVTGHLKIIHDSARFFGGFWISGALYIASQLAIPTLRLALNSYSHQRVSVLRNPHISTQLSIAEETGILMGVLNLMLNPDLYQTNSLIISIIPFVLVLAFLPLFLENRGKSPHSYSTRIIEEYSPQFRAPYLSWMIALLMAIVSLKWIQWFGMAYGLSEAERTGNGLMMIYSKLSIVQSLFTLAILIASLNFSSKIPTWSFGFKALLAAQAVGAGVLIFLNAPIMLMGAEIARKVMEHGFFSRSLELLNSNVPESHRLQTHRQVELWSVNTGIAIAGMLSMIFIFNLITLPLLWMISLTLIGFAFYLRKRLFETLSDFHVAHIIQLDLGGVIQACNALANPECRHHYAALTSMLERKPRPIIAKSILNSLGKMQNQATLIPITQYFYENSDREDIQLAAIKALQMYEGHEINLLFLKTLRKMIYEQTGLGEIRTSIVKVITRRLGVLAVPLLLEVLENNPDERVLANAIEVLGEIALEQSDEEIFTYLSRYLNTQYSRRIRANAIIILYNHKKYGDKALEFFDRLLTSPDPNDSAAAAYIAGMLQLRGHETFIWEQSMHLKHRSSTHLLALIRFDNPDAPQLLAQLIAGDDEKSAQSALIHMSALSHGRHRSTILYELMENWPSQIDLVLKRMQETQRDFEWDRGLVREEAYRRGILLKEDAYTFNQDPSPKSAA